MPRHDDDDYDFDRPRGVGTPKRRKRGRLPVPGPIVIALGITALLVLLSFLIPGVGHAFVFIGLAVVVVGNLWFLAVAASDSVGQLLLCMFVPFYTLFYLVSNFDQTKWPFGLCALGLIVILGSNAGVAVHEGNGRAPAEVVDRGREEPKPAPRFDPPRPSIPKIEPKTAPPKTDPVSPPNPAQPFEIDPQAKAAGKTVYLAALTPFAHQAGPWPYLVGATGEKGEVAIKVQNKEYKYGLSAHPPIRAGAAWRVSFAPGGEFKRLKGWGAVNDNTSNPWGKIGFGVWGDGKKLWESGPLDRADATAGFDVDVTGVRVLTLETRVREGSHLHAHAVWLDPWLER